MNEKNLSLSDQIIAFIEGSLSPEQEDNLFKILSSNPGLRSEFKQHKIIDDILKNDSDSLLPPSHLKTRFMSSAGLEQTSDKTGWATIFFGGFFKSTFKYISIAIISSLIALLLYEGLINDNNNKEITGIVNKIPVTTNNNLLDEEKELPIPIIESSDSENTIVNNSVSTKANKQIKNFDQMDDRAELFEMKNNLKKKTVTSNMPEASQTSKISQTSETIHITESPQVSIARSNMFSAIRKIAPYPSQKLPIGLIKVDEFKHGQSDLNGITLSLRGITAKSLTEPQRIVNNNNDPFYKNIAIGIGYSLDNQIIGIEAGYENFEQYFEIEDEEGIWQHWQNPNLLWGSVYFQYNFNPFFSNDLLRPFIKANFGGTELGPLGRIQIGMEYKPDSKVSLYFGLEGYSLGYFSDGNPYFTNKGGITYGIRINY